MKRLIWLPVAGFLLVAGATVAAAAPGLAQTASSLVDVAWADDTDTTSSSSGIALHVDGPGSLLADVLADLVASGEITQEQSDAITAALTTAAEERRTELEQQREQLREMWTQIRGFLEDGVITADEIAQLPEDNPFSALEGILEDGQVTLEELQSVGPFGGFPFDGRGPGGGHGHGFGPRGPGMWVAPDVEDSANDDANSSPDATSQNS